MTKYVIAIASAPRAKPLQDLLGVSDWTVTRSHGPWTIFIHTDAAHQYVADNLSLFKGWCIDHARERLVFGSPGVEPRPAPENPIEGCYVAARFSDDVLTLGHDLFCQLPLLHFCDDHIFVASDSMFALSEIRKALALPCRLNEQVARARAWTTTLGLQNHSDQTLLADVHYNGVGAWLVVNLSREALRAEARRTPAREVFAERHVSHAEAIREAAVRVGRHIASFAAAGRMVSLGLSGGHDSRAVAAAASLVAPTTGDISVTSNARLPRDFEVASSLAQMAGLPVRRRPPGLAEPGSQLSRWLANCAGLYDRLHFASDRDPAEGVFSMGGHGGELSKGMWGWARISRHAFRAAIWEYTTDRRRFTPYLAVHSQAALRAQCKRGLRAMGLSSRERWSAEWHYLGYRNAIHGGRTA